MACSAIGMMNDHALRVEASLLYLPSLVPSQQPSRLASTGMQSSCLPAVAPPEEPSGVGGPASGLLCRTPDSGSNQAGSPQKALRLPSPLNQLPWDIAQDQFGAQGADFIEVMGALLVRLAQDQFASYSIDSNGDPYQVGGMEAQYQLESAAEWSGGGGQAGYASGISSTGASP